MADLRTAAFRALKYMDLTSLNDDDTDEKIVALCKQAKSNYGKTAAICIYPKFIKIAKEALSSQQSLEIKVATVTNFPHGNSNIAVAVDETKAAVALGADEVDVVFPYKALISGDEKIGFELVSQCKSVCGPANVLLKVIIETGELKQPALIKKASEIAIKAGADFIKTSTGKVPINATPESAEIMLTVIRDLKVKDTVGFKAAGGVKTAKDASIYLTIADRILGENWVNARHFRFGASSLLKDVIDVLSACSPAPAANVRSECP